MEAVMLSSSVEKSMSPYNKMKNPERLSRSFVMRPSENMPPMSNIHGGLLFAPPPSLASSFPPFGSVNYNFYQNQRNHHLFRQKQPPLLPLPVSQPLHSSLPVPARSRSLSVSSSPTNRKTNRSRDKSITPKKSKSKQKKDLKPAEGSGEVKEAIVEAKASPDPKNLPKDLSKILSSSFTLAAGDLAAKELETTFSGSFIYSLSPHPSSLPLPKFSLRPKLNCKAEAAGIDTGATDDLRRMLRLP